MYDIRMMYIGTVYDVLQRMVHEEQPTWLPVVSKGQSAAGLLEVPQFDSAITRGGGQQVTSDREDMTSFDIIQCG